MMTTVEENEADATFPGGHLNLATGDDWTPEFYCFQTEFERLRRSKDEEFQTMTAENKYLQRRLEDTSAQLNSMSEKLSQTEDDFNLALNKTQQENEALRLRLETEEQAKEDLKRQVESLMNNESSFGVERIRSSNPQHSENIEFDDQWKKSFPCQSKDSKDGSESEQRIEEKERELREELHRQTTELKLLRITTESRESQLSRLQKDFETTTTHLDYYVEQFRNTREENIRLQVKVDAMNERIEDLQNLVNSVQRKFGDEQQMKRNLEEKLIHLSSSMTEKERLKSSVEDRLKEQKELIEEMTHDLRFAENRRELLLQELKTAQSIIADKHQELTRSNLNLDSANRSKKRLEDELEEMKRQTDRRTKREGATSDPKRLSHRRRRRVGARDGPVGRCLVQDDDIDDDTSFEEKKPGERQGCLAVGESFRRLQEENRWLSNALQDLKTKNERQKTLNADAKTLDKNRSEAEIKEIASKLSEAQQKNVTLTKDSTSLKDQLKKSQKRVKELELIAAETTKRLEEKASKSSDSSIKKLQVQCDRCQKEVLEEKIGKVRAEKELLSYKAYVQRTCVPRSEMEEAVAKVRACSQAEVGTRILEIHAFMKEQMKAREELDRLRGLNELEMKQYYDKQRDELQSESTHLRRSYVQLASDKASLELETLKLLDLVGKRQGGGQDGVGPPQSKPPVTAGNGCRRWNSSADAIADGEAAGGTPHSIRSGWDRLGGERAAGGTEPEAGVGGGGAAERPGGASGRSGTSKALCVSCDSLVQKVLCHLDRSIAKHLEKASQPDDSTLKTPDAGPCGR